MQKWLIGLAVLLGVGVACSDPRDRAAKARIFSPEAPPPVVASALEPLALDSIGRDPAVAQRVLSMGAAESTERLGSFRYRAQVRFEWAAPASLSLAEERSLVASSGGVSGDFSAVVNNSRDQGLEVLRAAGRVFAKSRFGTLRERKRDRGMSERAREDAFSAVRDITSLFAGRVRLESRGSVTHEGRSATRFIVSLGPAAATAPDAGVLPPPVFPKGGLDESTQRRLAFFERREPQSLSGELWVDDQTSVVLKATLEGILKVPAGPGANRDALVDVSLESLVTEVGKVGHLPLPEHFLPDADKPSGIAEALERFGIRTRGDAGVSAEPDDDAT